MNAKEIGNTLVELRGNRTQAEIAEKLGITQSCYSMYENGSRIPSDEMKIKIAQLYKRTVQFIFFRKE